MPAFTNAKQNIPQLFKEIMRNHDEQSQLLVGFLNAVGTQADWRALRDLRKEMQDYRRAAEEALRWNTNKGSAV